MAAAQI